MKADAIRAEQAERRARSKIRREAVERLKLPFCRLCGGATEADEPWLLCDCVERRHELEARLREIVWEHAPDDARDLGSVLAP